MQFIQEQVFDQERALYGSRELTALLTVKVLSRNAATFGLLIVILTCVTPSGMWTDLCWKAAS